MKSMYLEHANITVSNLEASMRFFKTAFPHFEKRGGGISNNREWLHFGDDDTYVALNSGKEPLNIEKNYASSGINHLGFVVNDVAGISQRLEAAGYERSYPKQVEKFRIREYFYDGDGNEFEFVEYLSDNVSERNFYD